ncbi:Glycine/D-amino acid oxidase [Paenibacillus sp. UNC496MF]|uniref:NAD(P)/FAD-dependent oxidoreductase n=1 Tax=Paenibacillus sp. UNC496MF TaxID=1502753 RepID=UPI0008E86122|nr:FAD-dependent oxidoreductase [Paenibacillus sp. UNC496MF]SFI89186.1 Glycine/D-amino acid oxidase [Paenibacillus sp. UNC496MF]
MKDLHEGRMYWQETLPHPRTYPALRDSADVDAAVVGGGMSGAVVAYVLASAGLRTALVERGGVAAGSSLANTGLLQYCNDIMLSELIGRIGERDAVRFYRACAEAVQDLGAIASALPIDAEYRPASSLYCASTDQDVPKLKREYEALKTAGFDVEYWEPEQIGARYPFRKPGAIVTHGDAQVNPYRFVHAVVDEAAARFGLQAHEQTDIVAHETAGDGTHVLRTAAGPELRAKHVVYAVGYEPEELRGRLIRSEMDRSSVIVTPPQRELSPWYGRYMIWETARPYFYTRLTEDGRVIAGGYDEPYGQPLAGHNARDRIAEKLSARVQELFPSFDARPDYEWNATFARSRDDLPFIGEDPKWPRVYYCLGYGGNGTVYSMIGAGLLRALILGRKHPLAGIVGLDRPSLQPS